MIHFVARDVCVLGRPYSRMWCPHDIGRDNWVWGEQGTLEMISSPHEVGEVALTEGSPCREETGWPVGGNGCCCCCCC